VDDKEFYIAHLTKGAEVGIADALSMPAPEPPALDLPPTDDDKESDEKPKEDKGDNSEIMGRLDKIEDMLKTLVGGDDPDTAGDPVPKGHGKPLPPPVMPPGGGIGHGMGNPMMAKRLAGRVNLTTVRDNSRNVKMAAARTELDTEFGPYGFKVKKMIRRDDKIVAGLVRVAYMKDELIPDEENIDPATGQRIQQNQRSQMPWQGNDAPRMQNPGQNMMLTPEQIEQQRLLEEQQLQPQVGPLV